MKGKVLLITGGTGSFGNAVLERYLANDEYREIRVLSRDEKKQNDMRLHYNSEKLRFYIGDVRDRLSIEPAIRGVDFIFHAAALKQVPSCEFFPMEAVKTNVIGTFNVISLAKAFRVKKVVCLSTDKAAYPINAMGISKAMMEKIVVSESRDSETEICLTRYGNVMASRGSVIPLFVDQVKSGKSLTITNPHMTRFLMTLDDAVDLVEFAFKHGNNGDLLIYKSPASTIEVLAKAILKIMNSNNSVEIIGTRHGEKLYETLCTAEELENAIDEGDFYRIVSDQRGLNYAQYFEKGMVISSNGQDYNSHNTRRLDIDGTVEQLRRLNIFS